MSTAEAEREIEPIDAESELRAAFDHEAVPYQVQWVRPNRHRSPLLGLFNSIEPGQYRLVPAGSPEPGSLLHPSRRIPPPTLTLPGLSSLH